VIREVYLPTVLSEALQHAGKQHDRTWDLAGNAKAWRQAMKKKMAFHSSLNIIFQMFASCISGA
jgi:hypothetical protein